MDYVSLVGYARLEKYIAEELCGANYSTGYGGLTGDVSTKIATWLALHDILRTSHNVLSFLYGNTIDVTENDFDLNYTIAVMEMVPFAIVERIYRTGISLLPVPVTEKTRVPTKEEIAQVHTVVRRAIQLRTEDYEKMLDLSKINEMRALLVREGDKFFQNIKGKLREMGVNVSDPLQLLLAVRRLGAARLEELCHPGERNPHLARGISPFISTGVFRMSMEEKEATLTKIRSEGLEGYVRGKQVVTGSTDAHEFGLFVLSGVLRDLGAKVVEGGISLDPEEVLDLAAETSTPYIALSTHNGLCLDYARDLMKLTRERGQNVRVFMGGRLNGILEGCTEPVDVSDRLTELGVTPCREVTDLLGHLAIV